MPGVDRYVYVRIIPFDKDIGVSDTIVFRLDINYPPVVMIDSVFGVKRVRVCVTGIDIGLILCGLDILRWLIML